MSGHAVRAAHRALPLPAAFVLSLAVLVAAGTARAQLQVDINRGHVEPLPIALVDLAGANEADAKIGRQITGVITPQSGTLGPVPRHRSCRLYQ